MKNTDRSICKSMTDYSSYTDEELVDSFKAGDMDAQDYLLDKYKNLVKAKEHTYFISGAGEEDIIQEGMIGLFKAIRDYSPEKNCSFKSFAEICVTRQIITAVKSSTRQKHMPMTNYVSLDKSVFDEGNEKPVIESLQTDVDNDPQVVLLKREDRADMAKLMDKCLSSFEKNVLELYLDGMSYDEIAEKTGKSYKSVDNGLQRVKKKLIGSMDNEKP